MERSGCGFAVFAEAAHEIMENFDYTRGMAVAMLFQLLILFLPALFLSEENEDE